MRIQNIKYINVKACEACVKLESTKKGKKKISQHGKAKYQTVTTAYKEPQLPAHRTCFAKHY